MKFAWFLAYAFSLLCTGFVPVASADAAQFDPIEVPGDRTSGTTAVAIGLDGASVVGNGTAYGFVWTNGAMTNPCSFFTQGQICRFTGVRGNSMAATVIHNNDATSLVYWAAGLGPYQPPCPDPNANCSAGTMVGPDAFVVNSGGWINVPNGASSMYQGPWIPGGANSSYITGTSSDAAWVVGNAQFPGNSPTGWYAYNGTDKICNLDPQGVLSVVVQGVSDEGAVVIGRANGILNSSFGPNHVVSGPAIWDQTSTIHCTGTLHFTGGITGGYSAPGGQANAVSSDGGVIVGNALHPTANPQRMVAFRWTCPNGMESIEQLLVDSGAGFRDLSMLTDAVGISSDGTTIAGNGKDAQSNADRAWRASIPLPAAPTLTVSPLTTMTFTGAQGGPFTPAQAQTYTLSRSTGGQNLYAITGLPNWLTVDDYADGISGSAPKTVNFSLSTPVAAGLSPGTYQATITVAFGNGFSNTDGISLHCVLATKTLTATLTVNGNLTASNTSGPAPLAVGFGSLVAQGDANAYTINFGDGNTSGATSIVPSGIACVVTGPCFTAVASTSHTYTSGGTYTATLLNSSQQGVATAQIVVSGGAPKVPPTHPSPLFGHQPSWDHAPHQDSLPWQRRAPPAAFGR